MDIQKILSHAIAQGMTGAELQGWVAQLTPSEFMATEQLCKQGERSEGLYLVLAGKVCVSQHPDGRPGDREITTLHAPTVVGELELITGQPSVSTVTATEAVVTYLLPHEDFVTLITDGNSTVSKITRNIAHVLAVRIAEGNRRFLEALGPDARHKFESINDALTAYWEIKG